MGILPMRLTGVSPVVFVFVFVFVFVVAPILRRTHPQRKRRVEGGTRICNLKFENLKWCFDA